MKSKARIEKKLQKKTNSELVETIIAAKKKEPWNSIADILSSPRRKRINLNLEDIEKATKDGEHIVVPGKVLSNGELNKKIKITAMSFSEKAKEKLLKSKIEISNMLDEIKKNPNAKGIKILTNIK
ncbi:MAG TPA: 50S ribosomal protein L18e [Patescibacteria group bacterium]|nr:50S ribosomal protein L18e [Patescibacteria group bacterium]